MQPVSSVYLKPFPTFSGAVLFSRGPMGQHEAKFALMGQGVSVERGQLSYILAVICTVNFSDAPSLPPRSQNPSAGVCANSAEHPQVFEVAT